MSKLQFKRIFNRKLKKLSTRRKNYLLKFIEKAKEMGITVRYTFECKLPAYSILQDQLIVIDFEQALSFGEDYLFSVFYHELAHFELLRQGKFKSFHDALIKNKKRTTKVKHTLLSNALNVEFYTDKIAKQMMKEEFPKRKYLCAYNEEDQQYVKSFLRSHYMGESTVIHN